MIDPIEDSPAGARRLRGRTVRRAAAVALLLSASAARADVEPLRVDPRWDVPITAGAAVVALVLATKVATPKRCRWCEPDRFDDWTRRQLVWHDTHAAQLASDLLANGLIPLGALANSFFSARHGGAPGAFWEDALVIAEATAITALLSNATADLTARRRPSSGPGASGSADRAFFSGHTSQAFAIAAAAGTVSSLRGYPSAPWVWASGMTLASGVAYLRVAGDAHWATDVLTGAAVGGLVGFAVPWLFHRVQRPGSAVRLVPAPGGLAAVF